MIPMGPGVSESLVVSPKEKNLKLWSWLRPAALSASPSVGRSPGGSLPAGGPCPGPRSTPGWAPQSDGEGAPWPGQAMRGGNGTGSCSLASTDILCQMEEKHQPRLGGMQKPLYCCCAPGRHPKLCSPLFRPAWQCQGRHLVGPKGSHGPAPHLACGPATAMSPE